MTTWRRTWVNLDAVSMVQAGDSHNDADGLGASIYMEGCSRGLKQIKIAGKDGDDVVIVQ